jgi:hypothetical protein
MRRSRQAGLHLVRFGFHAGYLGLNEGKELASA